MNCKNVKKMIPSYLDEDLKPAEREEVKNHLPSCESCRQEVLAYEKSWNVLKQWSAVEPDPGYISRFWTQLGQEKSWLGQAADAVKSLALQVRFVPVYAAIAVLAVTAVMTLRLSVRTYQTEVVLTRLSGEDMEMVENIDLAENFEIVAEMDLWEDMDVIESLEVPGTPAEGVS
ncbi:MAG: zf-HC2 domain-containing protein [Candidatus Omnitrophota bacterium]|nr:zf-HC2 domain-containing protein [Candidatus Omnitrophota bacterium]MDZ4242150.1 zf-HC2 domain-containing protein [Candidatus Omnitrophota bacterium]